MSNDRLFRQATRIDIAYPQAFANFATPTSTELNNSLLVRNITCALDEGSTDFKLDDPDTDGALSFCDASGTKTATFKNPTIALSAYRDADRTATGVFQTAWDLLAFPDENFIFILRVGLPYNTNYAVNQYIRMVGGSTDVMVSVDDSGASARIQNSILPDGRINWNYKLAA